VSNVRVWTVDDDGDLLRGGYYPRGASGTGMADDEADELRAILERGQAPAAPSEGDGRPSVHLLLDIWQAIGGESEDFHPWWAADPSFPDRWSQIVAAVAGNFDALAKDTNPPAGDLLPLARDFHGQPLTAAAPLPPGVHRAPTDELLCRGIDLPEGWAFYGPPETIGASDDESRPWWDWRDREADVRTGDAWYRVRPVPPVPEPEKVPWAEAIWNKRLIARTFEGREPFVAMFVDDATGTEFAATLEKIITDGDGYEPIDADGLVSVLPLGDPK